MSLVYCEDELNVEPAQSISADKALRSANTVKNILVGAYDEAGQSSTFGGQTNVMADLLGSTGEVGWEGTFVQPRQFFQKNILVDNTYVSGLWANSYEVINQANLVIDNAAVIDDATERATVIGEAKFLRGLTYFDLARHFGGVPLRMTGISDYGVELDIARSSQGEIFDLVISDLNEAYAALPDSNSFFADKYAAKALLARVYLQLGELALARDAANDVLANSGHSLNSTFAGAFNNDSDSVEDIFMFQVTSQGGSNQLITFYASQGNGGRGGDITIQSDYLDLFDDQTNDVRHSFYYESPFNGGNLTSKYTNQFGNVPVLRIAEMHLIRAETNLALGTSVGLAPLVEINALRGRSGAQALSSLTADLIFNERQLELAFEGHLIHDLKRLGKSIGTLASTSPKLVWPIPQTEMDSNSLMTQNSGY